MTELEAPHQNTTAALAFKRPPTNAFTPEDLL